MALSFERHRRLRSHAGLRDLVRESHVRVTDFIYPLFVTHEQGRHPISSMPGVDHLSLDELRRETHALSELGIPAMMIFGIPAVKDELSSEAYADEGIVQQAVRAVKSENPSMLISTDVCLCQYNPAGHCGIIRGDRIVNDESLELIAATALSHVQAGADVVAPSDDPPGHPFRGRWSLSHPPNGFHGSVQRRYAPPAPRSGVPASRPPDH